MTRHLFALAALVTLATLVAGWPMTGGLTAPKKTKEEVDYHLPGDVTPQAYNVRLVPYLEGEGSKEFTFDGTVNIRVVALEATRVITLHSNELVISEPDVEVIDLAVGAALALGTPPLQFDATTQFLMIHLAEPLRASAIYDIHLKFSGVLNEEMSGFYRSSYVEDGVVRWIATTQMELTDARKAFPCFDEPSMKATFSISIARKASQHVLGNMPRLGEPSEPDASIGDRVWDTFETTPLMSSYLVAFIVSEFESLTDADAAFGVWARRDAIAQGQYAMEVGPSLLHGLQDFLNVSYVVPKVDNVAISDFSAGAMENWGLVTYREASLLYEPGVSTEVNKQRVATVLAHEFAHFWFGDLVTPVWWEFTWLNEGFARYFQVIAVDMLLPEWEILDQFLVDFVQSILKTDALIATPKLSNPCGSPVECNVNFGTIGYSKGASVLRMLDNVLTRSTFQKGLQNYLNTYKFQAVTPDQLFAELDQVAVIDGVLAEGVTVKQMMDSWTLKSGHPYVKVSGLTDDKSTLVITQARVLLQPDVANPDASLWWVPLTWTRMSDAATKAFQETQPKEWLREEKQIVLNTDLKDDEWVIFNNQQTGFYRVAYDSHYWALIVKALRNPSDFTKIHELNRAQLLDDALFLARCGVVTYDDALDATLYLEHEVAYTPWVAAFNGFEFLDSRLVTYPGFDAFKRYVLRSMDKLYTTQPAIAQTQKEVLSRVNALKWACKYGLQNCVDDALLEFSYWLAAPENRVEANKKSVVYCTALREGSKANWDFLWTQYQTTNVAADQVTILAALGCTNDKLVLQEYLILSVTEGSGIRRQDAPSVFTSVYNNPEGVDVALDFLVENLPAMSANYLGSNTLGNAITGVGSKLTTQAQVDKLKQFARDNEALLGTTSALVAAGKAIEAAEADLEWAEANADTILEWMQNNTAGSDANSLRTTSLFVAMAALVFHSLLATTNCRQ